MNVTTKEIFTGIEKGFNIAGCLPVVSFFSGTLRAIAGKVQALAGAIISAIGFINFLISPNERWASMTNLGSEMAIHGALNMLRGYGEALLSISTLVGNLFLLIPNMTKKESFSPYFAYGEFTEKINPAFVYS